MSDSLKRLPRTAHIDMLHAAEQDLGELGVGLKVGRTFRPATFFDFGSALMANATVRAAMDFNKKYQAVNQQIGQATLVVDGKSAFVSWDTFGGDPEYMRPATEAVFAGYIVIGRMMTAMYGADVLSMRFRHAQTKYTALSEEVFNCPVLYNQDADGFEFDAHIADKPLPTHNPSLVDSLSTRLDKILESLKQPESIALKSYQVIELALAGQKQNAAQTAQSLGMSERTLRRRLSEEGTSYSDVLANVRQDLSHIYLNERHRSVSEIAQFLGYSEHSAFVRAFRNWYGMSPSEYREQVLRDPTIA